MNGKIKCTNCNNMIPIGAPYCIFCGAKQDSQSLPQNNGSRRKKRQSSGVPIVRAGEDIMVPVDVKEKDLPEHEAEQGPPPMQKQETAEEKNSAALENHTDSVITENCSEKEAEMSLQETEAIQKATVLEVEETKEENAVYEITEKEPETEQKTETAEKEKKNIWKDKKEKKAAEYEKNHDSLTGLYNRKAYEERLEKVHLENTCIIIGDMNGLSDINKMYGREDGDLLLANAARILQDVFGANCYRIGEDEFAVVLEKISEKVVINRIGSLHGLLKQQEKKLRAEGKQFDMKMAVGYAYGDSSMTVSDVEEKAVAKMQANKKQMKQVYNPNYDGYYNDVKAEYEEIKVQIDRDNMHKVIMLLIGFAVFMAFYFIFLV